MKLSKKTLAIATGVFVLLALFLTFVTHADRHPTVIEETLN